MTRIDNKIEVVNYNLHINSYRLYLLWKLCFNFFLFGDGQARKSSEMLATWFS